MSSDQKQKTADLLTICNKAGKTVKGFDSVCAAVAEGKASDLFMIDRNQEGSRLRMRKIRRDAAGYRAYQGRHSKALRKSVGCHRGL